VELDIEAIQAMAPGPSRHLRGPQQQQGVIDTYAAIVNSKIPVVSISWGGPRGRLAGRHPGPGHPVQAGAAQGQSLFAASGDSGSDDIGNGGTSVDFRPATRSSPAPAALTWS